ncbi:MAG: 4Fe-4S binding protein [Candidatus Heimdallarchaeota archaeon]|nr:4Fe-4S binding protein [Candidatus Heimdallarchaeota archaeon]MCK4877013.1 4Fe-4S binding protein [Candidatus Heimdallarchaeota archaeon]
MIMGRWIGNLHRIPSLRLKANKDDCINCKRSGRECPMSLPVEKHVIRDNMEHRECILCGTCIDVCSKNAITFSFSSYNE